ncbi:hypothetical protein A8B79_04320 [Balneola sp. EhC07]|uniref:hypothetical protein n=1 Tax=Balneola sp. EhC07 TaxID=1849360 RepID=UPI0007F36F89|nr:hypothetical protein [Balneola sp. EhC07]OAN61658.1 hypothetical protein A8B79_04320 [Balneola sp. EhC07]
MKNKDSIASLFLVLFFTSNTYSWQTSEFLHNELNIMNYEWGYRIKMDVNSSGNISSLPDQKIQMGLAELDRLTGSHDQRVKYYLYRFILAHEFAHQVQYYKYKNDQQKLNDDLITRKILETQAEINAGLLFFIRSPELYNSFFSQPELAVEVFRELFNVAFRLGTTENTIASHPSKKERMLAIRLGVMNGFSFLFDQHMKSNPLAAQQMGITPQKFKSIMDAQFEFIDIKQGDDILEWSYRQAQKIVNYDRKIASNLVLTTPRGTRHSFDTDPINPYAFYDLTYSNIGKRKLDVEMEVFIALVGRESPDSGESYRKLNVDHYKFSLDPGESKTIEGILSWSKNEHVMDDFLGITPLEMPRIVYPSLISEEAIYSVLFSDGNPSTVEQDSIKFLSFNESDAIQEFPAFFNSILNAFLLNDKNVIQSLGELNHYREDTYSYLSSIQFEDDIKTRIVTDMEKNIISIEVDFPEYNSHQSVHRMYSQIIDLLEDELFDYRKYATDEVDEAFVAYSLYSYNVKLEYWKNSLTNKFELLLSINKN